MNLVEFPELTHGAWAAYQVGCLAAPFSATAPTFTDRRYLAAFLREAMKQAGVSSALTWTENSIIHKLFAIANNLYNPPPTPPTLAEARAADLDTPEGRDTVTAFLATLGEEVQP